MILSKREKTIAIVMAAVLGLLVMDYYFITPYMQERAKLRSESDSLTRKLQQAERLFSNRKRVDQAWREMLAGGLKSDAAAGENQALHTVRDFAQNARVNLVSLKPDHTGRTGDFQQIRLQATGTGGMGQIAEMLWSIESTRLPLKLSELRLTSRKEGTDDLTFALSASTVVFSPAPEVKPVGGKTTAKGAAK